MGWSDYAIRQREAAQIGGLRSKGIQKPTRRDSTIQETTPELRIPFALERVTLLVRIPISWRGLRNWCEFHSLLTRGILWSESHSLWRGNPLEENTILLEEGTPLKRIPFAVDRGSPLRWISFTWRREPPGKGGKHLAGESHSLGGDSPEAKTIRCGEGSPLMWMSFTWSNLRRGPPGQDGLLYEANTIRIGEGDPHGAEPNPGHWCCEGDLLDAKRIWVVQVIPVKIPMSGEGNPLKRSPRLWLGESLATNQSEAFVRTATATKMTAEVVPWTRTVWKGAET